MPHLKLSYFDFNGGRGEPIRLALSIGNIPFEDHRFPVSDWPSIRESTPFHQTPVLEVDGEAITQSNALSRYVGRLTGLYPADPLEAARCDEVMDVVEDILSKIVVTFAMDDEEEKCLAREALIEGRLGLYLKRLNDMLDERGGEYFADTQLTVADLKIFVWIRSLRSGILDYIPADLVDKVAPNLVDHFERINSHPGVADYYRDR